MRANLALAASLSLLSLASALPSPGHVVHETRNTLNSQWIKGDRVEPNAVLPVRIGLTQTNLDGLYSALDDVSNPRSKNYGKHWTKEEVTKKFAPTKQTIASAMDWVTSSGISRGRIVQTENQGWLAFRATTNELESLLDTQFHYFKHATQGHQSVAADSYKVPKHIQRHIDYITPGIKTSPQPRPRVLRSQGIQKRYSNSTVCDGQNVTPDCYRQIYQIPRGTLANPSNSMGIYAADGGPAQVDLDAFFTTYAPFVPNGTYPIVDGIDGGNADPDNDPNITGEADLDFEISIPLIYPQTTTLWTVNVQGEDLFNPLLDALDGSYCDFSAFGQNATSPPNGQYPNGTTCGGFTTTNVLSVSYGDGEFNLPASFQERQCLEFAKLGLQGVSIVIASGDSGVRERGTTGDFCIGPDNNTFVPDWPATCPAVTAVGATLLQQDGTEVAATDGTNNELSYRSGSGFSNIYAAPLYQLDAIAQYFNSPSAPNYLFYGLNDTIGANGGRYNRQGRGYPDVSAVGTNNAFAGVLNGNISTNGGTSASTPIFGSIINLINEERLAAGKSVVGFLNPVLYANPDAFTDVTQGDSEGCGTQGFLAGPGWDPVTGLGTPLYPKLLQAFMSLP